MTTKKIIALMLAVALVLTMLAACNKTDAPADNTAQSSPNAVATMGAQLEGTTYAERRIDIEFAASALALRAGRSFFAYHQGRIYFERYTDITNNSGTVTAQLMELISVAFDSATGSILDEQTVWSREVSLNTDTATRVYEYELIAAFNVDDFGNLWLAIEYLTEDLTDETAPQLSRRFGLIKCSPTGEVLASYDMAEFVEVKTVAQIVFDLAGNAYLRCNHYDEALENTESVIHVFAAETVEFVMSSSVEPNSIFSITHTKDGEVAYHTIGAMSFLLTTLNAEERSIGTPRSIAPQLNYLQIFPGFGEWDILMADYMNGNNNIYGYNIETDTSELIMDFEKSGIYMPFTRNNGLAICNRLGGLVQLSDTEYLIGIHGDGLYKLTYDPNKKPTYKIELTLGVTSTDSAITSAVSQFNRESETLRIVIRDYSAYNTNGDSTGAIMQLDLDILTGNVPDIIWLGGLSPEKYISKGILADLTEYLDNDTTIDRADLFENILELGSVDGALYHITTHFAPRSLVGKASVFGSGGITMAKLNEVLQRYPNAQVMSEYAAADWITLCTAFLMDELVDWGSGTTNFDTVEYVALLNSAWRFPTEVSYNWDDDEASFNEYFAEYVERFADNRLLLTLPYLSDARGVRVLSDVLGDEGILLGFPSSSGTGNAMNPFYDFGISEKSPFKDKAWEFISMLIRDDYDAPMFGVSINRNIFEANAAADMVSLAERDFATGLRLSRSTGIRTYTWFVRSADEVRGEVFDNYPLTQTEVDTAREAIENVTKSLSGDTVITSIIREEAEAFLGGARNAEESARIIQSRVGLYVAENT